MPQEERGIAIPNLRRYKLAGMTTSQILLVGVGGGLGAIGRALLATSLASRGGGFPVGTLVVNLLGCGVAGLLAGWLMRDDVQASVNLRLFLFTGLLGGFTTFSAFGLETVTLLRRGDVGPAVAYVLCSLIGGVAILAVGWWITSPRGS